MLVSCRPRHLRLVLGRVITGAFFCVAALRGVAQTQPAVEALIVQLASDDWRARQAATDRLIALGDEALPRLTKLVEATTDGEVRTRAQAAIRQIEDNRQVGTTLVTLDLANVPAAQAYAELARQAGAALASDPVDLVRKIVKPVSLHVERRPFWQVMQSFSAQTGLEVTGITRRNREIGLGVTRGGTDWMDKPITLAGPLLIRADRLSRVGTIELKPPRDVSEEFAISLTVFAEPKLKVLDFSQTIRLDEALDERGNSLVPPEDPNALAVNAEVFGGSHGEGNTSRWEVGATLHHPKGMGTRIARLRGAATLMVETRSAALDLPLASAQGATRTVGALRVTVKSADPKQLELTVFRDGRTDAEWYAVRMQLSAGQVRLLDDHGKVVGRSQGEGSELDESPDNQRMELRLRVAREAEGNGGAEVPEGRRKASAAAESATEAARLVWEIPVEARELVVPFEFRDLPIP